MIMADSCFTIMIESFYGTIQNDIHDNYSKLIDELSSLSLLFCQCFLINFTAYFGYTLCIAPYLKEFT